MTQLLQELNDRFRKPGTVEVIADRGGLPALWVAGSEASHGASAIIYLHGAHVAAWRPHDHEEVLWLSAKSQWAAEKPIRGGVPLCFPWFGPHSTNTSLPPHGFARLKPWTLRGIDQSADGITATFLLESDDATRAIWPHDFTITHHVTVGRQLGMAVAVHNKGNAPITFEEAQHTYFGVGDVRQVTVRGLTGKQYIDKVDGMKQKPQTGDITITAETDRVYLDTIDTVTIEDPVKRRRIGVKKSDSRNTVVWNPWIAKAKAMPDFGDEEWPTMICVETCNVGPAAVTLKPGETHLMGTQIGVEKL
jgi:glucose-6-phosphate 1-epimerase